MLSRYVKYIYEYTLQVTKFTSVLLIFIKDAKKQKGIIILHI